MYWSHLYQNELKVSNSNKELRTTYHHGQLHADSVPNLQNSYLLVRFYHQPRVKKLLQRPNLLDGPRRPVAG